MNARHCSSVGRASTQPVVGCADHTRIGAMEDGMSGEMISVSTKYYEIELRDKKIMLSHDEAKILFDKLGEILVANAVDDEIEFDEENL